MNDTTSIKVTRELRAEITKAVRANTSGFAPFAEAGLRDCSPDGNGALLPNALGWTDDSDLGDFRAVRDLKTINGYAAAPGCAELDLYVHSTRHGDFGRERDLETNVCVLIRDGHVVGATSEGREIAALKARLNFPVGDGF